MQTRPPADRVSVRCARTLHHPFLPLLALFLLVGCEETTAPTEQWSPLAPSEAIVDENDGEGLTGFVWLPPVVKDGALTAPFNDQLEPDVTICELDGDACAASQSPGFPLTLGVKTELDHYQALWDTKSPTVELAPVTYRARVMLGSLTLGYADFQFGESGGAATILTTADVIGVKKGRTLPLNFGITTDFFGGICTGGLDCKIASVDPGQNTVIITRDGDAAIEVIKDAVDGDDITALIQEKVGADCLLGSPYPWYNSCYTYELRNGQGEAVEINSGKYVILEQCLAEDEVPAGRIPEVQLGAQHADLSAGEQSDFELLPSDETAATLSCTDYVPGPGPSGMAAAIEDVKRGLRDLFLGRPLYAVDKGLGGRATELSTIAYVDPGLRVAGFDGSRGGFVSINSSALAPARAALQEITDPAADNHLVIDVGPTLTDQLLDSHVDVVILGTVFGNTSAIQALSPAEQEALEHYVLDGGCAILMPDNDTFGAGSETVNESLIDPFDLDITGTLGGSNFATIVDAASPLIAGPYGTVQSIRQNFPGWFYGFPAVSGVDVSTVATVGQGAAVVDISPWSDGQVSGGHVIAFSDANMFFAGNAAGFFAHNEVLFKNAIAACGTEPLGMPGS